MNRAAILCLVPLGLAAAFIFTPTAHRPVTPTVVNASTTDWSVFEQTANVEPKSGLRNAIEGRLRWLGAL